MNAKLIMAVVATSVLATGCATTGSAVSYGLIWGFNQFGPGLFYISISIKLIISALLLATLTGILAAAVPSRRAAALDPVEAIRHV